MPRLRRRRLAALPFLHPALLRRLDGWQNGWLVREVFEPLRLLHLLLAAPDCFGLRLDRRLGDPLVLSSWKVSKNQHDLKFEL